MVTVQFTQPENTVGEADGVFVLTIDKRGENSIPLQVTITVNSMSATGKEEDWTLSAKYFTLMSLKYSWRRFHSSSSDIGTATW